MSFIEIEAEFIKQEAVFLGAIAAVRIENATDEAFWKTVFSMTIPDKKIAFYPYSNIPTPNTTGKISVLKYTPFADAQLWLCIDSDYDYLRQSTAIQNKYTFQTYVYAVENYRCYAPSLSKVLTNAVSLSDKNVDFEVFFAKFSAIIHDLLICSVLADYTEGSSFSAREFGNFVSLPQHFDNLDNVLEELKIKVELQLAILKTNFPTDFNSKKQAFKQLGLTELNAYLFMRGHNLFDNVAKPLLDFYFNKLKNEHLETLKKISNKDERTAQLEAYSNQLSNTKVALLNNNDFKNCIFFLKIQEDIKRLIS
jgi:hypothetical protein